MTKFQLLILLLIIALVFYYLSEDKPTKPEPGKDNWKLVKKPIKPQLPKPTWPQSQIENEPTEVKWPSNIPVLECPAAQIKPTKFKGLNPPHSQVAEPFEPSEPSKPTKSPEPIIKLPSDEFILDNEFLTDDHSLNETYRQRCLTLLNDFTATPLTVQATKVLQVKDKPLHHYFQALWNLKGLPEFSSKLAQPLCEWINLIHSLKPTSAPTDYGWLTDDNLEFILLNYQPIQSALAKTNLFNLRTDLANIYHSFQKAKTNQDWDLPEFLQTLELTKAPYTLFPLRVSGNHWGLFIFHNLTWQDFEATYQVYYTSSGGNSLEEEKQQLEPFINQIAGENTSIQIITPQDRQSKGYDCGVYLVFYLQEILETGKLELNRSYSSERCQQFRWEWKERIGERWCQLT
jgi:hypothetical protein